MIRIHTVKISSNYVQDTMTEEQRMEEGRRMFQIFAARMFEQRVLTAYKEKVAAERQRKLIEELDEESRADSQKKAKKARDAQRKKEKLAQKKQAQAEEKAKLEAKKAAEEAALRAAEEKKAEEQRLKAEEKRKKKEAQKKAEEEERLRKEAEKQRRLQEQRERQAELERKQREAKEKERKEKEDLRLKEKEAKETREREAKERKEKQERDRREKEARTQADREARAKQKREELAAQQATSQAATQAAKRPPVPIPANLQTHSIASPHIPVATPVIAKAPTPIKLRVSSSQQGSNSSVPATPRTSGVSQDVSPVPSTPLQGSPGPIGPLGKTQAQNPYLYHPQASSPIHASLKSLPGMPPPSPFAGMQPMAMNFQPGIPMMAPGFGQRIPHDMMFPHQPMTSQFRPLAGPNGLPLHPGLNMPPIPQGRGFPLQHGPPGFPQQIPNGLGGIGQTFGAQKDGPSPQVHSRQQSASFDQTGNAPPAQPIARPAPIGRPSSVVHGQRHGEMANDIDDISNHLGSSALLDDSDEPLNLGAGARRSSAAPGNIGRQTFPPPFALDSAFGSPINGYNGWGGPPNPFGTSSLPGSNFMGGWGAPINTAFGTVGGNPPIRQSQPRSVTIRQMICRACKNLEGSTPDGYYALSAIKEQIENSNQPSEQSISEAELLDICETEGNANNGGGTFNIRKDENGQSSVNYEVEMPTPLRSLGAPGEIGSPIVGNSGLGRFMAPPPGL